MKIITQLTISAALIAALCAFGPAVAGAQQPSTSADATRSTQVALAGLDLSTPQGMNSARERLRGTAVRLCTRVVDEHDLSQHSNFLKCMDSTMTSALRQISAAGAVAQSKRTETPESRTPAPALPDRARSVSLTDLDLSTPDGARVAHERLYVVARTLCSQVADDLDLSHHTNYLACVDDAMARSLPAIQQLARKNSPVSGFARNTDK
jgi:UrcA family protein